MRGVTAGQKTVENEDWAAGRGPRAAGLLLAKPLLFGILPLGGDF